MGDPTLAIDSWRIVRSAIGPRSNIKICNTLIIRTNLVGWLLASRTLSSRQYESLRSIASKILAHRLGIRRRA